MTTAAAFNKSFNQSFELGSRRKENEKTRLHERDMNEHRSWLANKSIRETEERQQSRVLEAERRQARLAEAGDSMAHAAAKRGIQPGEEGWAELAGEYGIDPEDYDGVLQSARQSFQLNEDTQRVRQAEQLAMAESTNARLREARQTWPKEDYDALVVELREKFLKAGGDPSHSQIFFPTYDNTEITDHGSLVNNQVVLVRTPVFGDGPDQPPTRWLDPHTQGTAVYNKANVLVDWQDVVGMSAYHQAVAAQAPAAQAGQQGKLKNAEDLMKLSKDFVNQAARMLLTKEDYHTDAEGGLVLNDSGLNRLQAIRDDSTRPDQDQEMAQNALEANRDYVMAYQERRDILTYREGQAGGGSQTDSLGLGPGGDAPRGEAPGKGPHDPVVQNIQGNLGTAAVDDTLGGKIPKGRAPADKPSGKGQPTLPPLAERVVDEQYQHSPAERQAESNYGKTPLGAVKDLATGAKNLLGDSNRQRQLKHTEQRERTAISRALQAVLRDLPAGEAKAVSLVIRKLRMGKDLTKTDRALVKKHT